MDRDEMTAALASLITARVSEGIAPALTKYYADVAGVYFDGPGDHGRYIDWGVEDDEGDLMFDISDGSASVGFTLSRAEVTRLAAALIVRLLD